MNTNIFLQSHTKSLQCQNLNTGMQICVKKTLKQNKQKPNQMKKTPNNQQNQTKQQQQNKPTKTNQSIKKK